MHLSRRRRRLCAEQAGRFAQDPGGAIERRNDLRFVRRDGAAIVAIERVPDRGRYALR
jgi:hypothetical protein